MRLFSTLVVKSGSNLLKQPFAAHVWNARLAGDRKFNLCYWSFIFQAVNSTDSDQLWVFGGYVAKLTKSVDTSYFYTEDDSWKKGPSTYKFLICWTLFCKDQGICSISKSPSNRAPSLEQVPASLKIHPVPIGTQKIFSDRYSAVPKIFKMWWRPVFRDPWVPGYRSCLLLV